MMRGTFAIVGMLALLAAGLTGCQQPNMDEMMKPPARPAELDQLNVFVGTWEGTYEMTMPGVDKPKTGKGLDTFAWDADKWVLAERMDGTMDGHKMFGTGLWSWDAQHKRFAYYSADSYGMTMTGTGSYDAEKQIWHMKGCTRDTLHGHQSVGEGTVKFVDNNTMEMTWSEWDSLHLCKFMEMKGTCHRK